MLHGLWLSNLCEVKYHAVVLTLPKFGSKSTFRLLLTQWNWTQKRRYLIFGLLFNVIDMYFGHNVISLILLCVNYVHSITQIYVSSTLKFVYMVLWYANFIKKQILIIVNLNVRSMRSATSSLIFNEPVMRVVYTDSSCRVHVRISCISLSYINFPFIFAKILNQL